MVTCLSPQCVHADSDPLLAAVYGSRSRLERSRKRRCSRCAAVSSCETPHSRCFISSSGCLESAYLAALSVNQAQPLGPGSGKTRTLLLSRDVQVEASLQCLGACMPHANSLGEAPTQAGKHRGCRFSSASHQRHHHLPPWPAAIIASPPRSTSHRGQQPRQSSQRLLLPTLPTSTPAKNTTAKKKPFIFFAVGCRVIRGPAGGALLSTAAGAGGVLAPALLCSCCCGSEAAPPPRWYRGGLVARVTLIQFNHLWRSGPRMKRNFTPAIL